MTVVKCLFHIGPLEGSESFRYAKCLLMWWEPKTTMLNLINEWSLVTSISLVMGICVHWISYSLLALLMWTNSFTFRSIIVFFFFGRLVKHSDLNCCNEFNATVGFIHETRLASFLVRFFSMQHYAHYCVSWVKP